MTKAYPIPGVLPDGMVDELSAGTNIAVVGPSMTGKQEIAIQLLAAGYQEGDGILCVTTVNSRKVFEDLNRHIDTLDRDRIGIIDCTGTDHELIKDMVEEVSSPGDLTGISVGTAKLFRRFADQGIDDIRYGLISISTLLQYLSDDKVFKFIHIFTNRVNQTGGLGVYTLDDDSHDAQVFNTLRSQFDGIIEIRETEEGKREARVRGFGRSATEWELLD